MIGGLLALVLTAWAGFSVEGPAYSSRGEASSYAKSAKEAGYKGRVVRRFREGSGWEFVVRVEGLDDAEAAKTAAMALVGAVPMVVVVLDEEGEKVEAVEPGAAPEPSDSDKPEKPVKDPSESPGPAAPAAGGTPWYEPVAEAHGPGLAALSDAERVKIVYTRKLPDGRIARHTYARRGTDLYLKIEGLEGEVAESTTLALADKAWLTTKGETSTQDLQRSRETIEKFGPTGIIPVVLDIEDAVEAHPMLASLEKGTETTKVAGSPVVTYTPKGAESPAVGIGEKDSYVRRISLDDGKRVHEYSKYTEVAGVLFPQRILSIRDGASEPDQVVIDSLELDGDLPDAWFTAPK